MKVCSKCKIEESLENFVKCRNSPDGYRGICKKCNNERRKKYCIDRQKKLSSQKKYRIKNKEKEKSYSKEYYIKNREKKQTYFKEYSIKNRENRNDYDRNRRLNDPIYKLIGNVRCRLNQYLKSISIVKSKKTFDIVGCSPEFLKEHLEKKFTEGMSWDRIGKEIHIDHIIPLSSEDNEDEIYKLCHYTNLQPLWAEDNLKKSNKILKLI